MIYHLQRSTTSGSINIHPQALAKTNPCLLAELILAGLPTSVSHALGRYGMPDNAIPAISEFQLDTSPTDNPARIRLTPEAESYIRARLLTDMDSDGNPTIQINGDGIIIASLCDGDTTAIILIPAGPTYVILTNTDAKKSTTWHHQTDRIIPCRF